MKILRALLLTALIMLIAIGLVLTFFPDLKEQVLGYSLVHRLKAGDQSDVALTVQLARGGEIVGEEVKLGSQVPAEGLQVNIRMVETVQATGREEMVLYDIKEMRRDKVGEGMKGVLGTEPFSLRVPAHGGVSAILRSGTAKNEILSDMNYQEFGLLLWPMLPAKRIKPASRHFSGSFKFKTTLLQTEELELDHRLNGELVKIQSVQGQDYAQLDYEGYIDPTPVKGETKVTGQGTIAGSVLIDMQTGRVGYGNFIFKHDYLLELKGARYRWVEQVDVKFYRGGASPLPSASPGP